MEKIGSRIDIDLVGRYFASVVARERPRIDPPAIVMWLNGMWGGIARSFEK